MKSVSTFSTLLQMSQATGNTEQQGIVMGIPEAHANHV